MNRTKIEWCDYTWNPITGCTYGCSYCYARKITERFPGKYPMGFSPHFWRDRLLEPIGLSKPARIFTCSMGDFWGPEIQDGERAEILEIMWERRDCRFLVLTKRPENIREPQDWTYFPPNLWQGVTVDLPGMEYRINELLAADVDFRFVSFEPLLDEVDPELYGIDWVIIGGQTNPTVQPKQEWIMKILEQADNLHIPVFEKDNLEMAIRKEYPKGLMFT